MAMLLESVERVGLSNDIKYGARFNKTIMKMDPNMMPIMNLTVSYEGKDDQWFEENVYNKLQSTSGVAEVTSNISANIGAEKNFAWELDGQGNLVETVSFSIQNASNSVVTDVAKNVISTLDEIKADNAGFNYNITMSQADYINQSVGSVAENLIIGGVLALIILWLFLRSVKMTLAIGISIPLAVIGTFVVMYFMGIGLNIMSMSGLALAVGMLVDNSVVVLENIFRLRSKGMGMKEAAIKGSSQMMGAMIGSSLTTICVFFPMFFLEGMFLEVFIDLIWVMILSLSCSLLIAVMFLPAIISSFKIEGKKVKEVKAEKKPNIFNKIFDAVKAGYNKCLNFSISKKWVTVGMAILLFAGSIALLMINGFILMPATDEGTFSITASLSNDGKNVADKKELADELYNEVKGILGEDLENCVINYSSGADMASMMGQSGVSMEINVTLKDDRSLSTAEAGDLVWSSFENSTKANIQDNYNEFELSSSSMTSSMMASDVSVTFASSKADITNSLNDLDNISESLVNKFNDNIKADLGIRVIEWEKSNGLTINKSDKKNTATITFKGTADADINEIQAQVDEFVDELLNGAYNGQELSVMEDGLAEQMAETYLSLGIALAIGFILIYLVMVAVFQSFLMPAIIMICVPLGFTGAFLGLFICGMPLSAPALIGMLILMGVIINNGILAVDYINQARKDGLSVKDAVFAAMHVRIRPIFMTALTTILALLPMALGLSFFNSGSSAELTQPLAVVSIGGLLFGTITTLLVIPAFYCIFCKDKKHIDIECIQEKGKISKQAGQTKSSK